MQNGSFTVKRMTFGPFLYVQDGWVDDNNSIIHRRSLGLKHSHRLYIQRYFGTRSYTQKRQISRGWNFLMYYGRRWNVVIPWFPTPE